MIWRLAYRARDAAESTQARVKAPYSAAAVERLLSEISVDSLVLYVRRVSR